MTAHGSELYLAQVSTYQRLALGGRPASATLLGLRETGEARGCDPEVELELELTLDGIRRRLVHRQFVSRLAAGEFRLGAALPVRVDPDNPAVLVIA
ncbi:MAG TPA: hypothetical protein VM266_03380 [Solirubrobacteraceae bacterium]|nr:hypothetical protein [Solirubrobacteraceae bacterium]